MKQTLSAPASLDEDQLAALDIMQSVASKGLDENDRNTMEGLADVIAGRTFNEAEAKAHTAKLIKSISARYNV